MSTLADIGSRFQSIKDKAKTEPLNNNDLLALEADIYDILDWEESADQVRQQIVEQGIEKNVTFSFASQYIEFTFRGATLQIDTHTGSITTLKKPLPEEIEKQSGDVYYLKTTLIEA